MKIRRVQLALGAVLAGVVAFSALAQQKPVGDIGTVDLKEGSKLFKKPGFSPYAGRNYPTDVYPGDTRRRPTFPIDRSAWTI